MMLYNVEFSQDGKTFDNFIGDYVKAWNAEEAKEYALTSEETVEHIREHGKQRRKERNYNIS